uniref:Angiopoietin-4 n=1 Tax=Magallana gigas TaxID=29159 RepID=K1Q9B4_MAGGI
MTTNGGGWTAIQKRVDGSTNFYRTWKEYKEGFGNPSHDYWIGNDVIHQLTKNSPQKLRVHLERFSGEKGYAEYSHFTVGNKDSKYKLTLSGYIGTVGNSLDYQNGMMFTTKDQDNDKLGSKHCANDYYEIVYGVFRCFPDYDKEHTADVTEQKHVNCLEILRNDLSVKNQDGVYSIYPDHTHAKRVYCDMTTDGGGWTVIQKRVDGSTGFYKTWKEYREGFGNASRNYWIGNDVIHLLTKDRPATLRVDLQRFSGEKGHAKYSKFAVGDENSKYKLTVSGYSGNIGDKFSYHDQMMFSTKGHDNDKHGDSCAQLYHGGWWYRSCHDVNLNGLYAPSALNDPKYNCWRYFGANYEALKTTQMMIRS